LALSKGYCISECDTQTKRRVVEGVDWLAMLADRCGIFTQPAVAESDRWSDDGSAGDGGRAEFQHVVINRRDNGRVRMYVLSLSVSSSSQNTSCSQYIR